MILKTLKTSLGNLATIEQTNRRIVEKFVNMTKLLADSEKRLKRSRLQASAEESSRFVEREICGTTPYAYTLRLVDTSLPTVFKHKPVTLRFVVSDLEGVPVELPTATMFNLELWLSANPTMQLEKSHKGHTLLSGCTQVSSNGEMEFRKFYISEVSSHYTNNNFILVIRPLDLTIRPFILRDFVVKARKPTQKEVMKRLKTAKDA
jgi:hypothetical protein